MPIADAERGEVTIRTAREADAAQIAELATQLGYAATEPDMRDRLRRIQTRTEGSVIVAELGDGRVCGWIMVVSVTSLTSAPRAEVAGLVVDRTMRGMGIGSLLLHGGFAAGLASYEPPPPPPVVVPVAINVIEEPPPPPPDDPPEHLEWAIKQLTAAWVRDAGTNPPSVVTERNTTTKKLTVITTY